MAVVEGGDAPGGPPAGPVRAAVSRRSANSRSARSRRCSRPGSGPAASARQRASAAKPASVGPEASDSARSARLRPRLRSTGDTAPHLGRAHRLPLRPGRAPVLTVDPGTTVEFETLDARAGALYDRPVGDAVRAAPPHRRQEQPDHRAARDPGRASPATHWQSGSRPIDVVEPRLGRRPRLREPALAGPRAAGARADRRGRTTAQVDSPSDITIPGSRRCSAASASRRRFRRDGRRAHPRGLCRSPRRQHRPEGGHRRHDALPAGERARRAALHRRRRMRRRATASSAGPPSRSASVTRVRVDVVRGAAIAWPWLESADRWMVLVADNDFVVGPSRGRGRGRDAARARPRASNPRRRWRCSRARATCGSASRWAGRSR